MDLSSKILSDPVIHWVFSQNDRNTYLVGGYVRDILMGRENRDKDFVLRRAARHAALETAKKFGGRFIELMKNRTFRVVLEGGSFLDFSVMDGAIEDDLLKRDFTINAMAWSPRTGLIDPLEGKGDIGEHVIKVIRPENLSDDPLRVLRAYRLSAVLDLHIEGASRKHLRQYAPGLKKVARERITEELFKLLNSHNAGTALECCYRDKVLLEVAGLTNRIIRLNTSLIVEFDRYLMNLRKKNARYRSYRKINRIMDEDVSQGLNRAGFIKLSMLMSGSDPNSIPDENCLILPSNFIKRKLKGVLRAIDLLDQRITAKRLYEIFRYSNNAEYEIAIIISLQKRSHVDNYFKRAEDYMRIRNNCILNGNEIKMILKDKPGPVIGEIQERLKQRQFTGKTTGRADARKWIISNLT